MWYNITSLDNLIQFFMKPFFLPSFLPMIPSCRLYFFLPFLFERFYRRNRICFYLLLMEGGGAEDFILLFKEEGRRIGRKKGGSEERRELINKEGIIVLYSSLVCQFVSFFPSSIPSFVPTTTKFILRSFLSTFQ